MKLFIKLLTMAMFLCFALLASHFVIYKPLIVQRLPSLHATPLLWWLGAFAPQLLVFLGFGIRLKSWRELIIFSIVAACIHQIFGYLLWTWNEPGHLKSFESPVFDWTVGLLAVTLMSTVFFSAGFLIVRAIKRDLNSLNPTMPNKSLDASGGSATRNLLGAAEG